MPDDRGKFEGRTYLYIKTHPLDNGTEPLPAGLEAWMSPDIVVIQPNGTRGLDAVAGQQNQVEVTVTNDGGVDATNAYVDVFFSGPATGFTPATAASVGTGFLNIPGYSRRQITVPWAPLPAYTGHGCLLARVSLVIPPDTYRDATIFDVVGDRHVAQRNINVIALPRGQRRIRFAFQVVNPDAQPMEFRIRAEEPRDPAKLKQIATALGCSLAQFGAEPLRIYGVTLRADGDPVRELAVLLEARATKEATLLIERNEQTPPDHLHAINIVQIDGQGKVRGGLTVLARH